MKLTIALSVLLLGAPSPVSPQAGPGGVQSALASMDKIARGLSTLSFRFRTSSVEGKKTEESAQGVVRVVGMANGDFEALVELQRPEPGKIYYHGLQYRQYDPKRTETTTESLKEYAALVAVLKLLMPGTSGKRLSAAYDVTAAGPETVNNSPAMKLVLVPKSMGIRQQVPKAEIWLPARGGFPVRLLVIFSGSPILLDFSDVVVNPRFPKGSVGLQ